MELLRMFPVKREIFNGREQLRLDVKGSGRSPGLDSRQTEAEHGEEQAKRAEPFSIEETQGYTSTGVSKRPRTLIGKC